MKILELSSLIFSPFSDIKKAKARDGGDRFRLLCIYTPLLVRVADYLHHCMACKCCTIYSPLNRWQYILYHWLIRTNRYTLHGSFWGIYRLLGGVFNGCSSRF